MILTIPTIFLEKGKSKYSITGLPEFSKLDSFFKENPFEIAKLFREENNKSILFQCDNSTESINIIKMVSSNLDIPIQVLINSNIDPKLINLLKDNSLIRVFASADLIKDYLNTIPIIKLSNINSISKTNLTRIMIDFEKKPIQPIQNFSNTKISVINAFSNTILLSKLNEIENNIDSIYLGNEYYGTHYAGQLLWRIAEKAQFSI